VHVTTEQDGSVVELCVVEEKRKFKMWEVQKTSQHAHACLVLRNYLNFQYLAAH
jgi:hypothetical protein